MSDKNTTQSKQRDPSTPLPPREKLSPAMQRIVDRAEEDHTLYEELYDGRHVSPLQFPRIAQPLTGSVPLNLPSPTSVTLPTPPESEQHCYLPNVT